MYARLRTRIIQPSVCLQCTLRLSAGRHYTSRAPKVTSSEATSNDAETSAAGASKPDQKAKRGKKKKEVDPALAEELARLEEVKRQKTLTSLKQSSKLMEAVDEPIAPTLDDLDAIKPKHRPLIGLDFVYPAPSADRSEIFYIPAPQKIEKYTSQFEQLVNRAMSSFSAPQLAAFTAMGIERNFGNGQYGKPRPPNSLKTSRDRALELVRWRFGWPYPSEILARKGYLTQRSERAFLLRNSELFLILGTDGSDLRRLAESYDVSVEGVTRVPNGFALVLEGLRGSLDLLGLVLSQQKTRIKCEELHLTFSPSSYARTLLRSDLIPRISKLTRALVEDLGDGKFRISSYHSRNIEMAKRLVTRSSQQMSLAPPALMASIPTPVNAHHTEYALFPFELSKPEKSPFYWALIQALTEPATLDNSSTASAATHLIRQSVAIQTLFRARRVTDFLDQHQQDEVVRFSGLSPERNDLVDISGQTSSLRSALGLPELEGLSMLTPGTKVTALFGHVVFVPSHDLPKTFLPSLTGSHEIGKIFDWVKSDATMTTFIPELPGLLTKSSPLSHTLLTRLVYRSPNLCEPSAGQPLKTLKFEFTRQSEIENNRMSQLSNPTPPKPFEQTPATASIDAQLDLREDLAGLDSKFEDWPENVDLAEDDTSWKGVPLFGAVGPSGKPYWAGFVEIWEGDERFLNVMLPDRPMDMQLSSFESKTVRHEDAPSELNDYASNLMQCSDWFEPASRPVPPLQIEFSGKTYILDWDATVKSSFHAVTDGTISDPMEATVDSSTDFETKEHLRTCALICPASNIKLAWNRFLDHCDRISRAKRSTTLNFIYPDQSLSTATLEDDNTL